MRILLTNSPLRFFHTTCFLQPDWGDVTLCQLAAMVDDKNEIRVLDNWTRYSFFSSNRIIPMIKEFQPDVLGISNSTDGDTARVLQIVKEIKKQFPKITIIAGGQAATTRYDHLLKSGIDIVVLGEGEITFRELIRAMNNKERDYSHIKGLAYKKGVKIIKTPERLFVKNLDELPMPARKYLPKIRSRLFPGRYTAAVETSRGCPCGCSFCSVTSFYKKTYRKKSNDAIIRELKEVQEELGPAHVYFVDDNFGVNVKEYTELFKRIIDEGIDIRWYTQIRPDTIANNPKMMRLAKESGFYCGLVGFDSYNKDLLKSIGKIGGLDVNRAASQIFRKNNIIIHGVHMFGIPGQTKKEFELTYKYGKKYSDLFRMSFFSPIPGTPTFEKYEREGKIKLIEEQKYPYAFTFMPDDKEYNKIRRLYFLYWLRFSISPLTFFEMITSKSSVILRMRWLAYRVIFYYWTYLFLERVGIRK